MERQEQHKDKYILSSLNNALKVLDILSVTDNLGVTDIVKISGIDRTSVFKILYTLQKRDYVFKTPNAKYRLGIKLASLGDIVSERQSISNVAAPFLRFLRDRLHETVSINMLNANGRTIIICREDGDSHEHVVDRIGFELDAQTTAPGKVLLAYLNESMRASVVEHLRFKVYTPYTITTPAALYPILDQIRVQGYAEDRDERYLGRSTLAAPIFDNSRQCIAALGLVCTNDTFRMHEGGFRTAVCRVAQQISAQMGYCPDVFK